MATATTRSILIELQDGRQMVVRNIPSNAKVTFGKTQQGSRGDYGHGVPDTAVRVYTTAGNQLAVFRNANSFRDLSLEIEVQEISTSLEDEETVGPKGRNRKINKAQTLQWVQG